MASQQLWRTQAFTCQGTEEAVQGPLTQQGSAGSKLETVCNLTKVGEDEDENMDDDAQESDTTHMSTEKQPASTSTEGVPRGLSLGAHQALAT